MESIRDVEEVGIDVLTQSEKDDHLMKLLSKNAYTTREISEELGISEPGAYTKMKTMIKRGLVERKMYKGKFHYYIVE